MILNCIGSVVEGGRIPGVQMERQRPITQKRCESFRLGWEKTGKHGGRGNAGFPAKPKTPDGVLKFRGKFFEERWISRQNRAIAGIAKISPVGDMGVLDLAIRRPRILDRVEVFHSRDFMAWTCSKLRWNSADGEKGESRETWEFLFLTFRTPGNTHGCATQADHTAFGRKKPGFPAVEPIFKSPTLEWAFQAEGKMEIIRHGPRGIG